MNTKVKQKLNLLSVDPFLNLTNQIQISKKVLPFILPTSFNYIFQDHQFFNEIVKSVFHHTPHFVALPFFNEYGKFDSFKSYLITPVSCGM